MSGKDLPRGDKLVLRGLKFHGFHGARVEEKKLGQKFVIDLDAWLDLHEAVQDSQGNRRGPSQNLLERVAHLIATATLAKFPQISAVRVEVKKPNVAVHGTIDYLGIEILRYQNR